MTASRNRGRPAFCHAAFSLQASRSFMINGQSLTISVSVGISMYPQDGTTFQALLANADSAMYYAKKRGTGIIQFFSPEMDARTNLRVEMENDLRRALENDEFILHYQPKVTIRTGLIESLEGQSGSVPFPGVSSMLQKMVAEPAALFHLTGSEAFPVSGSETADT